MFGIKVHLYMPAGMLSPGYEEENKLKPKITQKVEEGDKPISCDAAAAILVKGIERGNYQITNDISTEVIRCGSKGAVPGNGPLDILLTLVSIVSVVPSALLLLLSEVGTDDKLIQIAMPIFRIMTDSQAKAAGKEVEEDLRARGFYAS